MDTSCWRDVAELDCVDPLGRRGVRGRVVGGGGGAGGGAGGVAEQRNLGNPWETGEKRRI